MESLAAQANEMLGGPVFSILKFAFQFVFLIFVLALIYKFLPRSFRESVGKLFNALVARVSGKNVVSVSSDEDAVTAESDSPTTKISLGEAIDARIALYQKSLPYASESTILEYVRADMTMLEATVAEQKRLNDSPKQPEPQVVVGGPAKPEATVSK